MMNREHSVFLSNFRRITRAPKASETGWLTMNRRIVDYRVIGFECTLAGFGEHVFEPIGPS